MKGNFTKSITGDGKCHRCVTISKALNCFLDPNFSHWNVIVPLAIKENTTEPKASERECYRASGQCRNGRVHYRTLGQWKKNITETQATERKHCRPLCQWAATLQNPWPIKGNFTEPLAIEQQAVPNLWPMKGNILEFPNNERKHHRTPGQWKGTLQNPWPLDSNITEPLANGREHCRTSRQWMRGNMMGVTVTHNHIRTT